MNVVCLKWGTKYTSEWVNRLYYMAKKNCNGIKLNFYCVTEDDSGLHEDIHVVNLPEDKYMLETYWWKLWITSDEFPVKGRLLYLDLDTIIQNDLSAFLKYSIDTSVQIAYCKWRTQAVAKENFTKGNSSIMIWDNTLEKFEGKHIWETFINNPDYYMLIYAGNDQFLEDPNVDIHVSYIPNGLYYSRVWGYDDQVPQNLEWMSEKYLDVWNIILPLYHIPDRVIMMLNGVAASEGIDMRIWDNVSFYFDDFYNQESFSIS